LTACRQSQQQALDGAASYSECIGSGGRAFN
jgi:hypothetical protein